MRAVSTALLVVNRIRLYAVITRGPAADGAPTYLKSVARFMGITVNRIVTSGATIALALLNTLSCSDSTAPSGLSSDDLSADASRIASISVTLTRATISVGDTTSAAAKL